MNIRLKDWHIFLMYSAECIITISIEFQMEEIPSRRGSEKGQPRSLTSLKDLKIPE